MACGVGVGDGFGVDVAVGEGVLTMVGVATALGVAATVAVGVGVLVGLSTIGVDVASASVAVGGTISEVQPARIIARTPPHILNRIIVLAIHPEEEARCVHNYLKADHPGR